MGIRFNADEVFRIAERIERDAATYYQKAADQITAPGTKQVFSDLADWEEQHEKTFASLHQQLSGSEKEETAFDPYGEAGQYLKALADESLFVTSTSPLDQVGETPDFGDVVRFAIGKERDSISFYTGIKQMVPASLGQDQVDKIIREEMKHVTILMEQLQKSSGG